MIIEDGLTATQAISETRPLTCDELIRTEIAGKSTALGRYDSILWKVRSGYAIILYSGLAILGTTGLNISTILGNERFLIALIMLIWGFSICGYAIDINLSHRKLRVVEASNRLYILALDLALGKVQYNQAHHDLDALLTNAGESLIHVPRRLFWYNALWIAPIYLGTPIIASIIYGLTIGV